ncbi:MAG: DegT/DnrJ/EryC1/StrS family aminotransferase [Cytophagales bacterium]|nr:MAG: DegT/DnrJ/EryC1/StrS family aminotransferase [Cytophagales bacterium]
MVDLYSQHLKIKTEIEEAINNCILNSSFIGGEQVNLLNENLASFLGINNVMSCANGTDALQLAIMALNLPKDAEIIVPNFTFVAPAEVVALLGYKPIFADVSETTYNISPESILENISSKTKAIVVVHLFGQSADMKGILEIAEKHHLWVIEDVAQSLGAQFIDIDNKPRYAGTLGHIGTTSFFPTKNLGAMGDGGAVFCNDDAIASKIKILANHGSIVKYNYQEIGINSRLDNLQAAILNVKFKYFSSYIEQRKAVAQRYNSILASANNKNIVLPQHNNSSPHTYNQYTIQIPFRDQIKNHLFEHNIPSMIYYPSTLSSHHAYNKYKTSATPNAEYLSKHVLSLPMHPELDEEQIAFICKNLLLGLEIFSK